MPRARPPGAHRVELAGLAMGVRGGPRQEEGDRRLLRRQFRQVRRQRALALSRQYKERGEEARALRLLGAVAAHAEPPDVEQAENCYRQALVLADELGMRPLVAHCHLGLGTLYRKVGRDEQAQSELTTAAELYRAMEMPYWLARADAALAAVGD